MPDRYPGYDVLSKRDTPSWNEATRRVIDGRLRIPDQPHFFTNLEYATVTALADRIVPQPAARPKVPVAALIDDKLTNDHQDGFRAPGMPRPREAWQRGLRALDAEAMAAYAHRFADLSAAQQDALLARIQKGDPHHDAWGGMKPNHFWEQRLLRDIVMAYWSHPTAWSEMGFGGPASPRGYVRLGYDERDPWEAAEARTGDVSGALWRNRRAG